MQLKQVNHGLYLMEVCDEHYLVDSVDSPYCRSIACIPTQSQLGIWSRRINRIAIGYSTNSHALRENIRWLLLKRRDQRRLEVKGNH